MMKTTKPAVEDLPSPELDAEDGFDVAVEEDPVALLKHRVPLAYRHDACVMLLLLIAN